MRVIPIAVVPLVVLGAALVAACGQTINTNPMLTPSTAPASATSSHAVPPSPAPSPSGSAQNLSVTNDLRAALLAAGAHARGLTSADFTGLRPGATYYAYDPTTQTYWAGAALVPSPTSNPAMVSSQDDGAYTLFQKSGSGAWSAKDAGMAGSGGGPCPVAIPAAVVKVWGWPAGSCHPAR